ncbi:MAG: hypothetical protein M3493_12970 [Actinomycetota bacterium]|jgi:biotin carboxyl carrier protein|nr:hypothetical protein [Euzebyaceae bacterium]MDQ3453585.1 hypothetical protein [Actinomycetota bacterium]
MTELLTRSRPAAGPPAPADHSEPATALAGTVADDLVVVVAPSTGRFQPRADVDAVERGDLMGHVTGGRGRADEVRSPVRAILRDLLVRPGQLVMAGQGLMWLARA